MKYKIFTLIITVFAGTMSMLYEEVFKGLLVGMVVFMVFYQIRRNEIYDERRRQNKRIAEVRHCN